MTELLKGRFYRHISLYVSRKKENSILGGPICLNAREKNIGGELTIL